MASRQQLIDWYHHKKPSRIYLWSSTSSNCFSTMLFCFNFLFNKFPIKPNPYFRLTFLPGLFFTTGLCCMRCLLSLGVLITWVWAALMFGCLATTSLSRSDALSLWCRFQPAPLRGEEIWLMNSIGESSKQPHPQAVYLGLLQFDWLLLKQKNLAISNK